MFRLMRKYLKPYVPFVVAVLFFQTVQTIATLYLPNMNAHIIDNGVVKGDIDYIWSEGILMMIITLAQIACSILAVYFGSKAAFSMARDIRRDLYAHIQNYSLRELSSFGAPTLITRSTNDITQVQNVTSFLFTLIISAPIMFVGGIVLSLEQDVALSGVIAATFPVVVIVAVVFMIKVIPYFKKFQKKIDRMNEVLREQITGVRVVRAFTKENTERARFDKVNDELYHLNLTTGRGMSLLFPIFMLIINLSILAILWFGGVRVSDGEMEIGAITAFMTYMMYIMMAVLMSSMVFVMMPRAQVSAGRIRKVFKTKSSVSDPEVPAEIANPKGVLEFSNVEFRYSGAEEPVLRNVSFMAKPGEVTAIIGSTGCGKSTLLRLIPRLFDATKGAVTIDGVNLKQLRLDDISQLVGVIPQKSFLFSGTLESNLKFGKEDATREEMLEALKISQSLKFLEEKAKESGVEDLLQLEVSQGGTNFSGGQRQRLSIARAIVRKPHIYQFDDSFSALDNLTDVKLRKALTKITKDRTVIIVAQRVSTIRHADQILVMDKGEIVGKGTHEELLTSNDTYKEIVNSQLSAKEALQ
ncbi:MAG: ABC transporter ATP-binding protein/permease [Candidatus Ancillula sp.]|nr:ABC transporter ATP-binding protein/permease [Candidatus Ancillula sp.]